MKTWSKTDFNKKMKIKKHKKKLVIIIIAVILILIAGAVIYPLYTVKGTFYIRPDKYLNQFYLEPENSLDGVFVGSSAAYRFWIPTEAYKKTGMAIYSYGSKGTPFFAYKYIIKDILKTQKPKVIIIDIRSLARNPEHVVMGYAKSLIDYMPPSEERTKIIEGFIKTDKELDTKASSKMSSYKYPEFGSSYKELAPIIDIKNRFKGYKMYSDDDSVKIVRNKKTGEEKLIPKHNISKYERKYAFDYSKWTALTTEKEPLYYDYKKVLVDFLDYCDTLDCKVLFLETPSNHSQKKQRMVNTAIEIIKKHNYDVLNMNTEKIISDIGLDPDNDLYDNLHTNCSGAIKVTHYLSDIFKKRYHTEDHRNDSRFKSWDTAHENLIKHVKLINEIQNK